MRYQVRFVRDDSLPSGVDYAFARQGGDTYLFVRHSAVDPQTGACIALTRAWECWQAAEAQSIMRGLRSFAASASA